MYSVLVVSIIAYGLVATVLSIAQGKYEDRGISTHEKVQKMTLDKWNNTPYDDRKEIWNWTTEEEKITLKDRGIHGVEIDYSGNF